MSEMWLLALVKLIGFPGVIFVIWYLFWKGEKQKWELQMSSQFELRKIQQEKENKDRAEHEKKWDSMVTQNAQSIERIVQANNEHIGTLIVNHKSQMDRQYEISDRHAQAIEILANNQQRLIDKIDTNQFCPIIRENKNVG